MIRLNVPTADVWVTSLVSAWQSVMTSRKWDATDVSPVDDIARVAVSRGHLELVQPHACIYGEPLVLQSLERHRTGHWLQQRPEPVNTLRALPGAVSGPASRAIE